MKNVRIYTLWGDNGLNKEDTRILRLKCEEVPIPLDKETKEDIRILREYFLNRADAAGLAAPQIGIPKRIIIFRNRGFHKNGTDDGTWTKRDVDILVNPRITQTRGEPVVLSEGCLSCPGVKIEIARFPEIKIRAFDMFGQKINRRYFDYIARIVQHEIDHLDGKLIVDYLDDFTAPIQKRELATDGEAHKYKSKLSNTTHP
ncbi:MAG: peptide deformylase [Syntrophales bacterium]|nr:peptide deformylase [Syntrophales bacterium]